MVVAAVGEHHVRAPPGPATLPRTGGTASISGMQLGDVVAVAAGQRDGQRDAACRR